MQDWTHTPHTHQTVTCQSQKREGRAPATRPHEPCLCVLPHSLSGSLVYAPHGLHPQHRWGGGRQRSGQTAIGTLVDVVWTSDASRDSCGKRLS